jgi:AmmeMemoRadiSam system protein A
VDVGFCAGDNEAMTNSEDRLTLISVARSAILTKLKNRRNEPEELLPAGVERPEGSGGVFVTLKIAGKLRGCIGRLQSEDPVDETVAEMARSAAFSDPRFPPISIEELDDISVEISRLSEFFPVSAGEVQVGKHGLMLRLGQRSGLLLPQVPGEQGWNRGEFLTGLCRKSGLPDGSWEEPGAILEGFTAEVFGEE